MGKKKSIYLGIWLEKEIGAVVAVDSKLYAFAHETFSLEAKRDAEGVLTLDPYKLLFSLRAAVHEILKREKLSGESILGIGMVGKGNWVAAWDKVSGAPLSDAVYFERKKWQREGLSFQKTGASDIYKEEVMGPGPVTASLLYEKYLLPRLSESSASKDHVFAPLLSWVLFTLTGRKSLAIDFTLAHYLGVLNVHHQSWSTALLAEYHLTPKHLPPLKPSVSNLGVTMGFLPLPDGIPVLVMSEMHAAYHVGVSGGKRSSWAMHVCGRTLCFGIEDNVGELPYPKVVVPGVSCKLHANLSFTLPAWPRVLGDLVDVSYRSDLLYPLLPHSFVLNHDQTTSMLRIDDVVSLEEWSRSYYQSIGLYAKYYLETLDQRLGVKVKELVLGYGSRCAMTFLQMVSDYTQLPIVVPRVSFYPLIGVLMEAVKLQVLNAKFKHDLLSIEKQVVPQVDPITVFAIYQEWHQQVFPSQQASSSCYSPV